MLNRLERDGQISSRLVASTSGPARKYYLPTTTGIDQLWATARSWRQLATTVEQVLARATPKES